MLMPPLPSEPTSREPRPAERMLGESLSLSLLKGTRVLVQDGLDRLRHNRDRMPRVKVCLLREGAGLNRELQAARPDAVAGLTVRGCGWYIEARFLRSSGLHGSVPSPRQTEALAGVREEFVIGDDLPPGGTPPDNRRLANAMLKLVDVVENIDREQVKLGGRMEAGFAGIKTELTDLRGDVAELSGRVGNLEAGQTELRGGVAELSGRVGNLTGERYEQLFRDRMPDLIHKACRLVNLPHPTVGVAVDGSRSRQHYWLGGQVQDTRDPRIPIPSCRTAIFSTACGGRTFGFLIFCWPVRPASLSTPASWQR